MRVMESPKEIKWTRQVERNKKKKREAEGVGDLFEGLFFNQ